MTRFVRLLITGIAALAILPAGNAGAAGEAEIDISGTQFLPAVTQSASGSSVVWVNKEVTNYPVVVGNHNIVPDTTSSAVPDTKPFPTSSPLLAPGQKWECPGGTCTGIDGTSVKLAPGRYAYMCGIHPNHMHGILVVK
jgi:plastocyanin